MALGPSRTSRSSCRRLTLTLTLTLPQYDTLVMEEAAQVMEVETFIPMVLQNPDPATGASRLKRVVLIGDHHQLPPVVKNAAFQKYSRLDQSLFARFVRLGVPTIELDLQVAQPLARLALALLLTLAMSLLLTETLTLTLTRGGRAPRWPTSTVGGTRRCATYRASPPRSALWHATPASHTPSSSCTSARRRAKASRRRGRATSSPAPSPSP